MQTPQTRRREDSETASLPNTRVLFGVLSPSEVDEVMARSSVVGGPTTKPANASPKRALALTNGASLFGQNDARHSINTIGFGSAPKEAAQGKKRTIGSVASGRVASNPSEEMRPVPIPNLPQNGQTNATTLSNGQEPIPSTSNGDSNIRKPSINGIQTLPSSRSTSQPSQNKAQARKISQTQPLPSPPDLSSSLPQANPLFSKSNPTNGPIESGSVPKPPKTAAKPLALDPNTNIATTKAVNLAVNDTQQASHLQNSKTELPQPRLVVPSAPPPLNPIPQKTKLTFGGITTVDAPPSDPTTAPALTFSRNLIAKQKPTSPEREKKVNMLTLTPDHSPQKPNNKTAALPTSSSYTTEYIHQGTPPVPSGSQSPPRAAPIQSTSSVTASPNMPKSAMKPKSWADMVKPASTSQPNGKRVTIALPSDSSAPGEAAEDRDLTLSTSKRNGVVYPGQTSPIGAYSDRMGTKRASPSEEKLRGIENHFISPMIRPRGMINRGNMCFENTILQTLLFCGPFFNLMRLLGEMFPLETSAKTRLLQATIALVHDATVVPPTNPGSAQEFVEPYLPQGIYDALKHDKRFASMQQGQQEDAQEFLGLFLETLHEELIIALEKQSSANEAALPTLSAKSSEEGWLEVGTKGRTATTRKSEVKESAITRIFGGVQRSLLRAPGQKDSALSEPFLTLQLEVQPQNVETIEDALANLSQPETVNDYIVKGGLRVDATKQLFLEHLPPVLVLHLKRFSYNNVGGTIKNNKVVGYQLGLEISPQIMTPAHRHGRPARYQLAAVIYHHGRNATGGHYTVALRQQNGQWIDIDDTHIRQLAPADVAVDRATETLRLSLPSAGMNEGLPDRVAYVMFYTLI